MPLTGRIPPAAITVTQNNETQILGPNKNRILLSFTTDNAGPIYFRNDKFGNIVGGYNIVNTSGQYEFPLWKYGDLIYNPWFVYHNIAATIQIGIIEVEN